MSMRNEHTRAIADKLALDEYGMPFYEIPLTERNELLRRAGQIANDEMLLLTRNDKERLFYANLTD